MKIHGFLASRLMKLMDRSMASDQFKRALGECFPGWNFVPGRRAGGMRQRNQVEAVARMRDAKFAANYVSQFSTVDKLHDCQSTDGNNQTWLQNPNLIIHPRRTVANLIRRRDAIGAAEIFARETTADRGKIDFRSNGSFVHPAKLFEPPKKCFAGGVRERPFQRWFARARRLPNNHHIAEDGTTGHRRGLHARAATAAQQARDVTSQFNLFGLVHSRISHEGQRDTKNTGKIYSAAGV